jgi:hypothetical protein
MVNILEPALRETESYSVAADGTTAMICNSNRFSDKLNNSIVSDNNILFPS